MSLSWLGKTISHGRYQVTQLLGQGGMALVFKALDVSKNKDVVIKTPLPDLLRENPEYAWRFEQEMETLQSLKHKHIASITDRGMHNGQPFLVTDFLRGGSLEQRLIPVSKGKTKPHTLEQIREWLSDIAETLDFIHRANTVHRDVKPGNILFNELGDVVLSDFGIAKPLRGDGRAGATLWRTRTGLILGTPHYMAPETTLRGECVGQSDQYSLGVVVYQLLTGQLPFQAPTDQGILIKNATEPPEPLTHRAPSVSASVNDAVLRALSKEPDARFSNCNLFVEELYRVQKTATLKNTARVGKEISEEPDDRAPIVEGPNVPDWRRTLSAAGGVMLLVLAICLGWAAVTPGRSHTKARPSGVQRNGSSSEPSSEPQPPTPEPPRIEPEKPQQENQTPPDTDDSPTDSAVDTEPVGGEPKAGDKDSGKDKRKATPASLDLPFDARQTKRAQESWAEFLGIEVVTFNCIGMKLVLIPPGQWKETPSQWNQLGDASDCPPRAVLRQPIYMGVYEVTQREYFEVMGENPSCQTGRDENGIVVLDTDEFPVENVSWLTARRFCERLSELPAEKAAGRVYRLSSQTEWEYACRAGRTALDLPEAQPGGSNSDSQGFPGGGSVVGVRTLWRTTQVGQYGSNSFGLFDMHGNVWEWCADDGDDFDERALIRTSPNSHTDLRMTRGGGWMSLAELCGVNAAKSRDVTVTLDDLGFRVVATARSEPP